MSSGLKTYTKELRVKAVSGAECTPEMLAKINAFALKPLKAEEVYVRKFLMAHNCIDRDGERFPEEMLDQFASTMPGKACIPSHDRKSLPLATWFDSSTEEMTAEQFKAFTGETPKLPAGVEKVKVQWAWMYTLVKDWNEQLRDSIDGGIIRFCSIGFGAADLNSVKDSPNGPTMYWEYCCPGEALEGSLVWLGAQPGASAQKQYDKGSDPHKGGSTMKIIIAGLASLLGKSIAADTSEEGIVGVFKSAIEAKDTVIAEKDAKIKELEGDAADGREYRKHLVEDTVRFGAMIGEIEDTEKAKTDEETFLKTLPLARLKGMREKYEAKAREKFPTKFTFKGKDETDRTKAKEDAEEKAQKTTGKKDYTDPAHNELFSLVGK